MQSLLYGELVPWYRLLDPTEDHLDEVTSYREALERGAFPRPETLLELGAGAGNNASFLKRRFRCTLTDISGPMQSLSRALNPECEHLPGDMRTLRLGRTFDTVLVHDAVVYMTTVDELRAVAETAFVHTRPGGAAVFAPDSLRETFRDEALLHSGDDASRSLRCIEWTRDPDPTDDTCTVDYAFLLRDGADVRAVHDRLIEGLFSRSVWRDVLESAGYRVEMARRRDEDRVDEVFLCRRP